MSAETYIAALTAAKELIRTGDFSTGFCCCGSKVDDHGIGDGHSPVDDGDYAAQSVLDRIDAALGARGEQPA